MERKIDSFFRPGPANKRPRTSNDDVTSIEQTVSDSGLQHVSTEI